MKYLLAMIFVSSLVACSPWDKGTGNYKVYVDGNFADNEQTLIQQAVTKWETSTDSFIKFSYTKQWDRQDDLITISPSTYPALTTLVDEKQGDKIVDGVLGLTTYEGQSSVIMIAEELRNQVTFREVAEHELGHALGLQHTGKNTVMYHSVDGAAKEVVCADVEQLCDIWDCNPYQMPACL